MNDPDLEQEFRRRFRDARTAARMSQEDVADELGISQQSVAKLEGEGKRKRVGLNEAAGYARVLGVSLESLLGLAESSMQREKLLREYEVATEALADANRNYPAALEAVGDLEQRLANAKHERDQIEREISLQGMRVWQLGDLLGLGEMTGLSRPSPAQQRFAREQFQELSEDEDHGEHQEA